MSSLSALSIFLTVNLVASIVSAAPEVIEKVQGLKLAIVVYRHGDRSPFFSYPTDPYGQGIWPEGPGQLTLRGVKQQYKLGQFLRKRYGLLLSSPTKADQILIQSSGMSRTLKSAAANAAGLAPPSTAWDTDGLGTLWQPLPIFSRSIERDAIFSVTPCPSMIKLKNSLDHIPEVPGLRLRHAKLVQHIQNHTQLPDFFFPRTFYLMQDVFHAQTVHGYPLPSWVTPEVQRDIKHLANVYFHMAVGANDRQNLIRPRLRGGNMLRVIMEELVRRVNGSMVPTDLKLFVYSAHDENIAALLSALHLYDYDLDKGFLPGIPNYAASLMFELFQNDTVRIVYKNDDPDLPDRNPTVLTHPECSTFCPVQTLLNLSTPYFMNEDEWFEACKSPIADEVIGETTRRTTRIDWMMIGVAVLVVFLIFIAVVLGVSLMYLRDSRRKKRRHDDELTQQEQENLRPRYQQKRLSSL